MDKVPWAAAHLYNAAFIEEFVNWTAFARYPAEEHANVALPVRLDDFCEDLCTCSVEGCHAMNIKYDVLVVLCTADTWKSRMCLACAVVFETAQAILEITCVSKGEWLGNFNDQATLNEFDSLGVMLGISEVIGPRYAAKNLDARSNRVTLHGGSL